MESHVIDVPFEPSETYPYSRYCAEHMNIGCHRQHPIRGLYCTRERGHRGEHVAHGPEYTTGVRQVLGAWYSIDPALLVDEGL